MAAAPHVRALQDLAARVEVVGVHARNPQNLDTFCTAWSLPQAADGAALLDNSRVDALLVLTPPDARAEWVRLAAERQLPVLVEKPVERTTQAAVELVEVMESAGAPFAVVFQHRFRASSLKLRDAIASGALGRLQIVKVDVPWWRGQSYYDEPGRGSYQRDGGGVLISQAIHTLDLMLSFTGPVTEVRSFTATTGFHQMESEDFAAAGLRFENGAVGSVTATTAQFPGGAESIEFGFTQCTAALRSGVLTLQHHDGRTETHGESQLSGAGADPMAFPHDWHLALIRDFVDAIHHGRRPAVTARDALEVHRLIDAMVTSSASGRAVQMGVHID